MRRLPHAILCFALLTRAASAAGDEVDYVRDVKPLLKHHCYACHGALKQEAGLRLDTAELARKGAKDGPVLLAGKPAGESEIVRRITSPDPAVRMPQESKPLSEMEVATLTAWVAQGGPGPADEQPETDPKKHWSFQPVVRPTVPQVKRADWVRNPIDAFVAAQHERHGLTPLQPADKATLLRRVTLDLTGLPPTREQLHAFLADASPDAYETVVDRLLASPAYGERWGRHWMDVWRYSDWYGRRGVPDVMNSYPQIWRWRDWIVRSLNEDKGYDRMVVEMLAADEVAPTDEENLAATGFVVRNWYKWNYNSWMRDSVEHTGKAFLGITLNCNHCHDHKYDPFTKEEYFRFRAFFEPLELRHDRVAGEPDPGTFVKYVYGASYGPIASGRIRVFDEKLDAPTLVYNGGDERNVVQGKPPVQPGVPAALGGEPLAIRPVELPPTAWYPGLKPFVQQEEVAKAKAVVAAAEVSYAERRATLLAAERKFAELQQRAARGVAFPDDATNDAVRPVAQLAASTSYHEASLSFRVGELNLRLAWALLRSLEARIAAEGARYGGPAPSPSAAELMRLASKAEREAAHARAELELATAELALFNQARRPAATDEAKAALAAARQKVNTTTAAEAAARAARAVESDQYAALGPVYPKTSTGRRSALAKWIASPGNPLTARVAANHIWLRHFGSAIVASTFDFGRNGKPPTDQALLDWLAAELTDRQWSMKHLHRLIVTSNAYRMASAVPAGAASPGLAALEASNRKLDPDNVRLWRFNTKRMEAEVVRDSVLFAAGELDPAMGGPDIDHALGLTANRRSLYFTIHGEQKMRMLELFDAAEVTDCYRRTETVVPQQALALANSELSLRAGRKLAAALWESAGKAAAEPRQRGQAFVLAAFEQVLGRPPSADEAAACAKFLLKQAEVAKADGAKDPESRAREDLVHALLNHNDFVTVR